MAGILDSVDRRTQLVGRNRLELLTFRLHGRQQYGINVFKVQEVMSLPRLNLLPHSSPCIAGVAHVRGKTIPVIDLADAIGKRPLSLSPARNIVITEYNRSVQAFLVGDVDRIVNMNWDEILSPPAGTGRGHFLTAITRVDGEIVEIIDVEKVLAGLVSFATDVSEGVLDQDIREVARGMEVLVVDDSPVATEQARRVLEQLDLKVSVETNGLRALQRLRAWADAGFTVADRLLMLVTDAEMPEMDGYRLTAEIRSDPRLRDLYVVLHTSLSGEFNRAMVKQVGCDDFLSKFQPDALAAVAQSRIRARALQAATDRQ
ncbi:MAG: chemotaxis protein CheV [Spongiibacteraceae bacterium]|jgi:two-component system chemotaxis response regulator CheV|nr:chemotaxis protein CheV [Spongiibacteraceae bacterium]